MSDEFAWIDDMDDASKAIAAQGWDAAHDWLRSLIEPGPSSDIDPARTRAFTDGFNCAITLLDRYSNLFRDEEPPEPDDWAVDPHHETADTLAVEDAADELAHKLGE